MIFNVIGVSLLFVGVSLMLWLLCINSICLVLFFNFWIWWLSVEGFMCIVVVVLLKFLLLYRWINICRFLMFINRLYDVVLIVIINCEYIILSNLMFVLVWGYLVYRGWFDGINFLKESLVWLIILIF